MSRSKPDALPAPADDTVVAVPPPSGLQDTLDALGQQQDAAARSAALEQLALSHAMSDQAAEACFYLCRSLGLARQQEAGGEPTLELLFQLLGALSDLPADVSAQPLPEGQADGLGIAELCHQLSAARELTAAAWSEAAEQDAALAPCPQSAARALH